MENINESASVLMNAVLPCLKYPEPPKCDSTDCPFKDVFQREREFQKWCLEAFSVLTRLDEAMDEWNVSNQNNEHFPKNLKYCQSLIKELFIKLKNDIDSSANTSSSVVTEQPGLTRKLHESTGANEEHISYLSTMTSSLQDILRKCLPSSLNSINEESVMVSDFKKDAVKEIEPDESSICSGKGSQDSSDVEDESDSEDSSCDDETSENSSCDDTKSENVSALKKPDSKNDANTNKNSEAKLEVNIISEESLNHESGSEDSSCDDETSENSSCDDETSENSSCDDETSENSSCDDIKSENVSALKKPDSSNDANTNKNSEAKLEANIISQENLNHEKESDINVDDELLKKRLKLEANRRSVMHKCRRLYAYDLQLSDFLQNCDKHLAFCEKLKNELIRKKFDVKFSNQKFKINFENVFKSEYSLQDVAEWLDYIQSIIEPPIPHPLEQELRTATSAMSNSDVYLKSIKERVAVAEHHLHLLEEEFEAQNSELDLRVDQIDRQLIRLDCCLLEKNIVCLLRLTGPSNVDNLLMHFQNNSVDDNELQLSFSRLYWSQIKKRDYVTKFELWCKNEIKRLASVKDRLMVKKTECEKVAGFMKNGKEELDFIKKDLIEKASQFKNSRMIIEYTREGFRNYYKKEVLLDENNQPTNKLEVEFQKREKDQPAMRNLINRMGFHVME